MAKGKEKLNHKTHNLLLLGLGAGLYSILYFFSRRPDIFFSWTHYVFFILVFITLPIITFFVVQKVIPFRQESYRERALTFVSVAYFFIFLQQILFTEHHKKFVVLALVLAAVAAFFLYKHLLKIVWLQLILSLLTLPLLANAIWLRSQSDRSWTTQPDTIEEAIFRKKPNVYFIEPDGYTNFSELKKEPYNVDTRAFQNYLAANRFTNYDDFRSNYPTTLASNASFFAMKQHYFNHDLVSAEVQNARQIILKDNPVLNIFKNNGYQSYYITDTPYILTNRTQLGFDDSNIGFWDINLIDNGIRDERKDVVQGLKDFNTVESTKPKFFFIQYLSPWHIKIREPSSQGKKKERELYIERLESSNAMLQEMINTILKSDPEALIVLMADHGGYVGYDYGDESMSKRTNRNLIYSVFSSMMAIRWPEGEAQTYKDELHSSVNMFRVLISYLSENPDYLKHLQDDSSYIILKDGTEPGVYQYIDDFGNVTCELVPSEEN